MPVTWAAVADADDPGAGVTVVVVDDVAGRSGVGTVGPVTPAKAAVAGSDSSGVSASTSVARRTVLFTEYLLLGPGWVEPTVRFDK
jgi:hypothetical protein